MLLMDELDYMRLYPAKRRVHIPVNLDNKRKGAAIMLLTKNSVDSYALMNMPYMYNPNLYKSLYIDRNVTAMIDSGAILDDIDEEPVTEAMQHVVGPKKINIIIDCATGNNHDSILMRSVYTENRFLKWYNYFKAKDRDIPNKVTVAGYGEIKSLIRDNVGISLNDKNSGIMMNSYSTPEVIYIVTNSGYGPLKGKEGPNWEKYAENELITYVIMNCCKNCSRYLAGQVAAVLSGQFDAKKAKKCEDFGEVDDEGLATCYVIYQLYKEQGQRGIVRLCKSGDVSILAAYASKRFIERMKTNLNISESASFKDDSADLALKAEILDIVDNLSDKEREDIALHGVYNISDPDISKTIVKRNDDGKLIGFLDLHHFQTKPYDGYITIAVDPNHRGQGIGKQMVNQLLQSAPIPNIKRYIWHVDPVNEPSVNLAKACGFAKNGIIRHRPDLDIDEDEYEYVIPFAEAERIPTPYNVIMETADPDKRYICNEDYITDGQMITFFNGMDCDVITEAEKKYDTRLKRYLFNQRLKNNKMVALRYEEMKAMNPWITRTYLKLPMYKQLNLFIDLSYYHGLFMNNMKYKKDMALNMYWDFLNRLINDTSYKSQYKKMTIFIPVWGSAWGVETVEELTDYTKSINPISLIFRFLKKRHDELKKWGNKDIVFMGQNGYFKVNFSTFGLREISRFRRLITKVFNNEEISEEENDDGYGPKEDDVSSAAAITASLIDKIEKKTKIKIDNLVGDNRENQWRDESLDVLKPTGSQFTHLRIRSGQFDLPNPAATSRMLKIPDTGSETPEEQAIPYMTANTVMIISPSEDKAVEAFVKANISRNMIGKKGFYKP